MILSVFIGSPYIKPYRLFKILKAQAIAHSDTIAVSIGSNTLFII